MSTTLKIILFGLIVAVVYYVVFGSNLVQSFFIGVISCVIALVSQKIRSKRTR